MITVPRFYTECQEALEAYLLELTDFFPESYQVGMDDTALARGGDKFIVLRPGSFPIASSSNTKQIVDYDWHVVMDTYLRYVSYEESWREFNLYRDTLIWVLGINPILECHTVPAKSGKNVWGVTLSSDEDAQYFRFSNTPQEAKPNFIIQTMQVTIRQRVEFPF